MIIFIINEENNRDYDHKNLCIIILIIKIIIGIITCSSSTDQNLWKSRLFSYLKMMIWRDNRHHDNHPTGFFSFLVQRQILWPGNRIWDGVCVVLDGIFNLDFAQSSLSSAFSMKN